MLARDPVAPGLQRLAAQADQAAPVQRLARLNASARGYAQSVLQRYPDQDGTNRKDALIYAITTNDQTEIIYVGQTTDARAGDRFVEHTKRDDWAPWWIGKGVKYGDDESKWPFRVHQLEALKDVTKFETTVAEQWWLEYHLKKGVKLLNDSTPCSASNFKKRSVIPALYDPKNIGVKASYVPSMKAK